MDKWKADTGITSLFGLKKLVRILSTILIIIVMVMSGIGMMTATTSWGDTLFTCVWCLSIVMIIDKLDKNF